MTSKNRVQSPCQETYPDSGGLQTPVCPSWPSLSLHSPLPGDRTLDGDPHLLPPGLFPNSSSKALCKKHWEKVTAVSIRDEHNFSPWPEVPVLRQKTTPWWAAPHVPAQTNMGNETRASFSAGEQKGFEIWGVSWTGFVAWLYREETAALSLASSLGSIYSPWEPCWLWGRSQHTSAPCTQHGNVSGSATGIQGGKPSAAFLPYGPQTVRSDPCVQSRTKSTGFEKLKNDSLPILTWVRYFSNMISVIRCEQLSSGLPSNLTYIRFLFNMNFCMRKVWGANESFPPSLHI